MATLSVVATPIGNLEDITLRALRVLREADLILCEDTRVTKKLLAHYGIATPTQSHHAHTSPRKIERILEHLREGKHLALVSDAGTPAISDPGARLIRAVRTSFGGQTAKGQKDEIVNIVAVPGPSAVTAALSVSGMAASEFLFLGFLPHKKGRETLFAEIAASKRTVVFYESPHRIVKALDALARRCPDRTVLLARELTKLYEEALSGRPDELCERLTQQPEKERGEFVVVVEGR